jgi:hypothetical protein
MADLTPFIRPLVADAMDAGRQVHAERRHSRRLGGSQIGAECDRAIWYGFRWAYPPESFSGRMLRLFETGQVYERRLLDELRRAGVSVYGDQDELSALGGHFVAKIDGRALRVPDAPKAEHLVEIKTHNEKSFKALVKDGVAKAKPQHFAQMQTYMHVFSLQRALYVAVNKNDDTLYVERVAYDIDEAVRLMARAERIIRADRPPPKLHDDPTSKMASACGYCPARSICHEGAFADRSCRTCIHSTALVDGFGGQWHCARWDKTLDAREQAMGCDKHLYIPDLVPGEQDNADAVGEWVSYLMPDGSYWVDEPSPNKCAPAEGGAS